MATSQKHNNPDKDVAPKKEESQKYDHCIFCGRPILINEYTEDSSLWAHWASPLKEGYCCGKCNIQKVLPFRTKENMKNYHMSANFVERFLIFT